MSVPFEMQKQKKSLNVSWQMRQKTSMEYKKLCHHACSPTNLQHTTATQQLLANKNIFKVQINSQNALWSTNSQTEITASKQYKDNIREK